METTGDNLAKTHPATLARMLRPAEDGVFWREADFAALLRHQLDAPLELPESRPALGENPAPPVSGLAVGTLRELLTASAPPLKLLEAGKDWFKEQVGSREAVLPREVATVLYYACILVASAQYGKKITSLAESDIHGGIGWALRQPWLDAELGETLRRLCTQVEQQRGKL